MQINLLLFLILLIPLSDQQIEETNNNCIEGCLKCNTLTKNCILCNYSKNYYLNNGKCEVKNIENCLYKSQQSCQQCYEDYYLENDLCVKVEDSKKITNCKFYKKENGEIICQTCKNDYILEEKQCVEVPDKIKFCIEYDDIGIYCLNCEDKRVPSVDLKECVVAPQTDNNCSKFQLLQCNQCNEDYIKDSNYYINKMEEGINDTKLLELQLFLDTNSGIQKQEQCRKINLENCKVEQSATKCKICQDFFFLDENFHCQPYPEERIDNCEIYLDKNNCKTCFHYFWRKTRTECLPVEKITKCETYSRNDEQICLKCAQEQYLDSNKCYDRVISKNIENCAENYYNLDLCKSCVTGYVINEEFTKCLRSITNCKQHEINSSNIFCVSCDEGYYLDNDSCVQGELEGCNSYQSQTRCEQCILGYYLDSLGQCQTHDLQQDIVCGQFSTIKKNLCEQCMQSRTIFLLSNICVEATEKIPFCLEYSNETDCLQCDPQKAYRSGTTCEEASTQNCIQYSQDTSECLKCDIDKITDFGNIPFPNSPNNKCVINNPNIYQNCEEIEDTTERLCSMCKEGFYPISQDNVALQYCFPKNYYKITNVQNLENCHIFDHNEQKCTHCSKNENGRYYVIQNGKCVDKCSEAQSVNTIEFDIQNNIVKKFSCENNSFFSDTIFETLVTLYCNRFAQNYYYIAYHNQVNVSINDNKYKKYICVECPEGTVGLALPAHFQNETIEIKEAANFSYLQTTSIFSHYSIYNRIGSYKSCLSENVGNNTTSTSTKALYPKNSNIINHSFKNCKFLEYYEATQSYYCIACKIGYSGQVVESQAGNKYMIEKCEIITQCQRDIWYSGLGGEQIKSDIAFKDTLNTSIPKINTTEQIPVTQVDKDYFPQTMDHFLSCHQCTNLENSENIPTYGVAKKYDDSKKTIWDAKFFKNFGIGSFKIPSNLTDYPYETLNSSLSQQTSCQKPGILDENVNFPANCAVQELNIFEKIQFYSKDPTSGQIKIDVKTNPLCVACKPGYKVELYTEDTANTNKKYYFYGVIKCEKIENCQDSKEFNRCEKCQEGYSLLDEDNYSKRGIKCYQPTTGNVIQNCLILKNENGNYICKMCQKGFVLNDLGQCDRISTYQCSQNNQGHYQNPETIDETLKFTMDGVGCQQCEEGSVNLILKSLHKVCIQNNTLLSSYEGDQAITYKIDNCLNYQLINNTQVVCGKCQENYILQSDYKRCWSNSLLSSCKVTSLGGTTCKECNEKYYFDSTQNKCVEGKIDQCMVYEDENNCNQCTQGFVATSVKGNRTLCFDVSQFNCEEYDFNQQREGNLKCNKCSENYFQTLDQKYGSFPLVQCILIPLIENCKVYINSKIKVTKTSLQCQECVNTHYLDLEQQLCIQRSNPATNCVKKKIDEDYCDECNYGYYLDITQKQCKKNPNSTPNCDLFNKDSSCKNCKSGYYLEGDKCLSVNPRNLILNCLYYRNSFECEKCNQNYFLKSPSQCISALATNCKEYINEKNCLDCYEGDALSIGSQITSCVESKAEKCAKTADSKGPNFKCEKCLNGYYPNIEQNCEAVQQEISLCQYYASSSTCLECEGNLILSQNKKECRNYSQIAQFKDSNCSKQYIDYQCSMCKPGYYFSNNQCEKCETEEGCKICNPEDIKICSICDQNYYMNDKGKCILNAGATAPSTDDDSTNTTDDAVKPTDTTEKVSLLNFLMILILL